jgi:uncharacterized protein YhaN
VPLAVLTSSKSSSKTSKKFRQTNPSWQHWAEQEQQARMQAAAADVEIEEVEATSTGACFNSRRHSRLADQKVHMSWGRKRMLLAWNHVVMTAQAS